MSAPHPPPSKPAAKASRAAKTRLKLKSADQLYISPDGRWLASSKAQGRIHLYDLAERAEVLAAKPLKNIDTLAFSPCSQYLSVTSLDGPWCVLAVPSGQVLLQGQNRPTQSVYQALHFLPDGSGLFVLDHYMRLDSSGPQPRWLHEREAARWRWPDGASQGARLLDIPFTTARVHADYPRGRYWLPHFLGVPLEGGNSTTASALCIWQGDVLTAEFIPIPLPAQAAWPPGHPAHGLWKNINAFSLAPDGDAALLLGPGYRANTTHELLLLCGQSLQTKACASLCENSEDEAVACALGQDVVAVSLRAWAGPGIPRLRIAFYARADLRPLGQLPLPEGANSGSNLSWHPSGQGMGLALGAGSVYHFDCPQQPEALVEWLRPHAPAPEPKVLP